MVFIFYRACQSEVLLLGGEPSKAGEAININLYYVFAHHHHPANGKSFHGLTDTSGDSQDNGVAELDGYPVRANVAGRKYRRTDDSYCFSICSIVWQIRSRIEMMR